MTGWEGVNLRTKCTWKVRILEKEMKENYRSVFNFLHFETIAIKYE